MCFVQANCPVNAIPPGPGVYVENLASAITFKRRLQGDMRVPIQYEAYFLVFPPDTFVAWSVQIYIFFWFAIFNWENPFLLIFSTKL